MTKDKSLEKIFLTQKPVFNDQDIFLQKLERKLEAVELSLLVKKMVRLQLHTKTEQQKSLDLSMIQL